MDQGGDRRAEVDASGSYLAVSHPFVNPIFECQQAGSVLDTLLTLIPGLSGLPL